MAEPPVGVQVTADRVLIRADRDDQIPQATGAGLYCATSLAAAVAGEDPQESWFTGRIVQLGPTVNRLDARRAMEQILRDLMPSGVVTVDEIRARLAAVPREDPTPLAVGDRVCFSWASGQQLTIGADRYLILRAGEVLAILEDDENGEHDE